MSIADWAKAQVTHELLDLYNDLPANASDCIECEQCIDRCPFDVDIMIKMREAAKIFEANTE